MKKSSSWKYITVKLPLELHRALKVRAAQEGERITDLVRRLLEAALRKE